MPIRKSSRQLVAEANARVKSLDVGEARALLADEEVLFVDIRDGRELDREGTIPRAFHAPRGMLEFWVDPESPYYKDVFTDDRRLLLFCQSSWRSALAAAALLDMGLDMVSHLKGGFRAWQKAGGEIIAREENRRRYKEHK